MIIFWVWKDYKKIDIYFINQSKITYNSKNLNSNLLKKIDILYNRIVENFLVTFIDNHKKYWELEDGRERYALPKFRYIKNKGIFTKTINNNLKNYSDWPRSHGNDFSNRFSNLTKSLISFLNLETSQSLKLFTKRTPSFCSKSQITLCTTTW